MSGWPDIHICDVFPFFLDTPGVQHGANYTGRVLQPAPPVYDPQRVADVMARLAMRPRSRAVVGAPAFLVKLAHALAPTITGHVAAALLELYFRRAAPAPVTDGSLFGPVATGDTSHGGWQKQNRPLVAGALAASGVGALGVLWVATRSKKTALAADRIIRN